VYLNFDLQNNVRYTNTKVTTRVAKGRTRDMKYLSESKEEEGSRT